MAIPANRAYGIAIALLAGIGLGIGGLVTAFRKPEHLPVAVTQHRRGGRGRICRRWPY